MDNLEEMDTLLQKYNLPRLNQEETENMNRPITSNETETVIKNLSIHRSPKPDSFTGEFYQTFREKLTSSFSNSSNIAGKGTLSSSFYETTITVILKPDKDIKKIENYRTVSLMNIGAKILNKI